MFCAAIALLALVVWSMGSNVQRADGAGFVESTCDTNQNSGATTTLTYLTTAGASTTVTCLTTNAVSVDLNLYEVGSSTSSVVQYDVAFSNNGIDWYYQTPTTVVGSTTVVQQAPTLYQYKALGPATTTVNQTIATNRSKYIQVRLKGLGAQSGVYAQLVSGNSIPN